MEPKFQTSFIPRKPVAGGGPGNLPTSFQRPKPASGGTSIFMTLAVLLFVVSLAGVGGAFLWKQYLIGAGAQYQRDLIDREKQFNIDRIEQLKKINVQIDTARQLLNQHLAMTKVFDDISQFTIQSVRFMSLDLTGPTSPGGDIRISMNGVGTSFSALAFQSDVLGSLDKYGISKVVKNPIIGDPNLAQNGTVGFSFTASIDPTTLNYENLINGTSTASH